MSQNEKLLSLLSDGLPHRTDEIMRICYGDEHLGLSRVGARIYDLTQKGHDILGWKDPEWPTLYFYRLVKSREAFSANPARETSPGMEGALRAQGVLFGSEKKDRTPWDFS